MAILGTTRLKVANGSAAVTKLWNDRYRLEFLCDTTSKANDWYYDNIGGILPDFTASQDDFFGTGVNEGWEAIPESVYPNMVCVEAGYDYIPSLGEKRVSLAYETLTDAWVQEKDDTIDYELNGLKRVSRVSVALPDTEYASVVGTTTIDSDGVTLYLGAYQIDETDAKWTLTETWLEAGELSREENFEDAKGAITITNIGGCPSTPAGFSPVNKRQDNTQGFETCTITFYENDSILSRSNDYVGSQLAEVIEVFNPSGEPTPTNAGAVLGNKSESNVDGIPTTRYTFLVPSVLSESEDKVGSQKAITIEAFNEIPVTPTGYVIANEQDSDVEGIPTKRYTFLKPSVLSKTTDRVGSQKAITIEAFDEIPSTPSGYDLANTQESDIEGIPTKRYTFLVPSVLSRSIKEQNGGSDSIGRIRTEVVEAFNEVPVSEISGVKIGEEESNVEGIPTTRHTFVKSDGQIRISTKPAQASLAGTNYVTVESVGTEIIPPGVLVESSDLNDDGFIRYTRTALQGTIVGVKTTYKDVTDVRVAGTVDLQSIAKSTGGISGTIAVSEVTPPRTKTIAAQVTIEITETPPDTVDIAYDLGNISCSVTSISMSENFRGTDVFTTASGNTRYSGQRKTADMSARISTYPECYLSGLTSNTGTFSYTSSYENQSTDPNSIVAIGQNSTTNTFVDGTGSTSADYATTGVIKRSTRPILTAIDGTVYYEVITWEV